MNESEIKWENIVNQVESFKNYDDSQSYYKGDFILHPELGKGYVVTSFANKIEVLFEHNQKTLTQRLVL